jgi:uncharacterized protein YxeA
MIAYFVIYSSLNRHHVCNLIKQIEFMNKNTLIGVIVVVILIVLGIWYFSSSNMGSNIYTQQNPTTTVSSSTTTTPANTTASKTNTFKSIFSQSGSHQCSYEQVGGTSERGSSVIYIADGQMRGEFRTTTTSGNSANLMIYNGGYLYSWKEGSTVGTKSSIKSLADLPKIIPTDLTSGAIFGVSDTNISWDCHDWIKDPKLFFIPAYVKFL